MKSHLEIVGTKEVQKKLQRLAIKYGVAYTTAIKDEAKELLEESKEQVPVLTGALKNSGRVFSERNDVIVAYGGVMMHEAGGEQDTSKYAIPQHERLDYNHPRGGKAKYLEDPFKKRVGTIVARVNAKIKEMNIV